jgi:hypothetical protein
MRIVKFDSEKVTVSTRGLDQIEVYVDTTPTEAGRRVSDGDHELPVRVGERLDVVGRLKGAICQRRRIRLKKDA